VNEKPFAVFSASYWSDAEVKAKVGHPFTPEQVKAACEGDGVLGEFMGAICVVSQFLPKTLGVPPDPRRVKLRELSERYQQETEAYDRTVCHGPIRNGGIMPANGHEMLLCSKNAHAVKKRLFVEAQKLGFSWAEFSADISRNLENERAQHRFGGSK